MVSQVNFREADLVELPKRDSRQCNDGHLQVHLRPTNFEAKLKHSSGTPSSYMARESLYAAWEGQAREHLSRSAFRVPPPEQTPRQL